MLEWQKEDILISSLTKTDVPELMELKDSTILNSYSLYFTISLVLWVVQFNDISLGFQQPTQLPT